jgi:hypothetical protein
LNGLNPAGLPRHKIFLKKNAVIILLRSLDRSRGLMNGQRLMVVSATRVLIRAQVLGGRFDGDLVIIPRIKLTPTEARFPFTMTRKQFPIALAFAISINKSQGQTLSRVGVFLSRPVFAHGQLFVAASRVGSSLDIRIHVPTINFQQGVLPDRRTGVYTRNVVFDEVIDMWQRAHRAQRQQGIRPSAHPIHGSYTDRSLQRAHVLIAPVAPPAAAVARIPQDLYMASREARRRADLEQRLIGQRDRLEELIGAPKGCTCTKPI